MCEKASLNASLRFRQSADCTTARGGQRIWCYLVPAHCTDLRLVTSGFVCSVRNHLGGGAIEGFGRTKHITPPASAYTGTWPWSSFFAVPSPSPCGPEPNSVGATVATESLLASSRALYLRFDFLLADAFLLLLTSIFFAARESSPFCRSSIFSARIRFAMLWFWLLDRVA